MTVERPWEVVVAKLFLDKGPIPPSLQGSYFASQRMLVTEQSLDTQPLPAFLTGVPFPVP